MKLIPQLKVTYILLIEELFTIYISNKDTKVNNYTLIKNTKVSVIKTHINNMLIWSNQETV